MFQSIQSIRHISVLVLLTLALMVSACAVPAAPTAPAPSQDGASEVSSAPLVIYSGRNENLVGPLIAQFQTETGIAVEVRYGGTAEMAATILEEGNNSPADVFFGQDAGALGALERAGRFLTLPEELLAQVDPRFYSRSGQWVGVSGRARVFVYNMNELSPEDLPNSVWDLLDPAWAGRVGWAPTNGSFQSFVTALRMLEGEDRAAEWLAGMVANNAQVYPNNTSMVQAAGRGEIALGLTNHYYLYQFLAEDPNFAARNYYPASGDAAAMINVAGAGIVNTTTKRDLAETFVRYLLSPEAQQYFVNRTNEYPLLPGIDTNDMLVPIAELNLPDLDLNDLEDLEGTLLMLEDSGALD
jgi:iron(III) transport system substrate-binding protein